MIDCLIIGDSIATGIAQHRTECYIQAQVGITSNKWLNKYSTSPISKNVLISLGSNDLITNKSSLSQNYNAEEILKEKLQKVRSRHESSRVTWILPKNNIVAKNIILSIAKNHGDVVLEINNTVNDGVHPTSKEYKNLSNHFLKDLF